MRKVTLLLAGWIGFCHAQAPASQAEVAPVAAAPAAGAAKPAVAKIDAVAATESFMSRLQGEARTKSDAYAEGGYWLLLWNLLVGLAVSWLLLARGISARIRDFAERRTRHRNLQTLVYVLVYVPLVALLTLPLTFYEGYYREHLYGLSNHSFLGWLGAWLSASVSTW
jgi:STE24 endopeptidase